MRAEEHQHWTVGSEYSVERAGLSWNGNQRTSGEGERGAGSE